jgi:peptide/nickel transport system permease protein
MVGGQGRRAADGRRLGLAFWISAAWVALIVLLALFAGLLPIPDPTKTFFGPTLAGPGAGHILGTDDVGRDLLSRLIFGARVSLVIGTASIAIGLAVGGAAGLLAGYKGGKIDAVLNAMSYVGLSFPTLVALIAIVAFWGHNLWKLTVVIGVLAVFPVFRVVRGSTLSLASREFVVASQGFGARTWRILWRELVPNVLPTAMSFALVGMAVVIVAEGSLAFLGLSVTMPTPSWGNMISEGWDYLTQGDPWISIWPSLAMLSLVLALNVMSDRLSEYFDVREALL